MAGLVLAVACQLDNSNTMGNSFAHGGYGSDSKNTPSEIVLRWMLRNTFDDKSTLVYVSA